MTLTARNSKHILVRGDPRVCTIYVRESEHETTAANPTGRLSSAGRSDLDSA